MAFCMSLSVLVKPFFWALGFACPGTFELLAYTKLPIFAYTEPAHQDMNAAAVTYTCVAESLHIVTGAVLNVLGSMMILTAGVLSQGHI